MDDKGYFPLLILVFDKDELIDEGREMVVETPQDIPSGKTFTVLETNYEPPHFVDQGY